jgi:hypothetical protein
VKCLATNAQGEQCDALEHLVIDDYCPAHRKGGREMMRELASLGGQALRRKLEGEAFTADELQPITSLEGAKAALDQIRVAVLTRRITHSEGASASKAVSEWVKTHGATTTATLVNELRLELEAKTNEIEALRGQLASPRLRVTS